MQILIKGYYGCNNLGDDYILYSIIDSLSKVKNIKDTNIYVYSLGMDLKPIFKLFPHLNLRTITANKKKSFAKALLEQEHGLFYILGGGGLFPEDNYKIYLSCAISLGIVKFFKRGNCVIYGIDICNIKKKFNRLIWRMIEYATEQIITRNKYSQDLLTEACGVKNISSYTDVTFGLTTPYEQDTNMLKSIEEKCGINDKKYIIWVFAMPFSDEELTTEHFRERYQKLVSQFVHLIKKYSIYQYYNLFIPFFHLRDRIMIQDIAKEINDHYFIMEEDAFPIEAKRALFIHASAVISMRFHGVAFALKHGTPVAALSYAQKTSNLMEECGLIQYCIEYGIREKSGFKKEFDFDINKLEEVTDNAVLHADKMAFSNASNRLISISKESEQKLIALIEKHQKTME